MDKKLAVHGGKPIIDKDKATFIWPRLTREVEDVVIEQLRESISIYDRSGIFEVFENVFALYHKRKYGLLSNSGTSAIFSMFEAISLLPGDEVLCPVYTFHASVSPMMHTGAIPIFCDTDSEGNITLKEIKKKVTIRTKAVVATHMWGLPVRDIESIRTFCQKNNLWLLEDCSHAHGASINGKKVGSFGNAASWSLQGAKTISGGEGGIMLTDSRDLYSRALLHGHYNKRPRQELDDSYMLKPYYLTGMGLKLRAHPLAIAIAMQQFRHLDEFIQKRQLYAEQLNQALSGYPFLSTPAVDAGVRNSWYAYNLLFDEQKAHSVTRQVFVDALHAEGLIEVDIPGSTGLLHNLPLFTNPHIIMPRMYAKKPKRQSGFPNAEKFYDSVIKLPVWTFDDEHRIVDAYIRGVKKVADHIMSKKKI